ncbi:hypothetical protein [uncultured Psychroserpens sp.]|uniref:hypothetical protein n=1 Tax=uncultured Psychroserpens sp. TaxID=255436 RepID=UPI0026267EE4|nr:hypothetical protein [uncultured Psychroserpens sp.]
MKRLNLLTFLVFLCVFGCTENEIIDNSVNPESITTNSDEPCFSTTLMAGQHHVAGSVTLDVDGDNLIITYVSDGEWVIGTTHLSIGNCDDDWVPLTGAGNPQVGLFEYTEPYSAGPYEVVYIISLEGLDDNICFAAHAEVDGPTGEETAWAEGTEFSGNGWAMFVETTLTECEDDDDGSNTPF